MHGIKRLLPSFFHYFLLLLVLSGVPMKVSADTTSFTYQGRLMDGAQPANGIYDLRFALIDSATNGNLVAAPLTNATVPITNGLFVVSLGFPAASFAGSDRWLEIAVRTNGRNASFTTLIPRQ